MVRKHEDVRPLPPTPCPPPCPKPPTPIIPVVSVSSVDGMTGDVILKDLVIGDQVYNGTDEIVITLEDLDLETAVRYRGMKTKSYIEEIDYPDEGDLYFCRDNLLFYLCIKQGEATWVNFKSLVTAEDIRSISVEGETLPVDDSGNVELPFAEGNKAGLVKFSEQFGRRPTDGCMIINFENIQRGSISVDKLKGDLWLTADVSVQKPAE